MTDALSHFAADRSARRTFCGLVFAPNVGVHVVRGDIGVWECMPNRCRQCDLIMRAGTVTP